MYSGIMVGSLETVALAQNSTGFSSIMNRDKSMGFAGMWLTISAGSVTITQQCALVGHKGGWLAPVDNANSALGVVCTTFAAGTYFVQYDPVLAPFIRFRVVETNVASTTVQFRPLFLEDR